MAKGVRVNLSVSDKIDDLLTELAQLSGRSKASWVMEAVGYQLPNWHKQLRLLKLDSDATLVNTVSVRGSRRTDDPVAAWHASDRWEDSMTPKPVHSGESPPPVSTPLSRQQRRAQARAELKKGRSGHETATGTLTT